MTDLLTFFPTNVSFYRVQIIEFSTSPTNITGFFVTYPFTPVQIASFPLFNDNTIGDDTDFEIEPGLPFSPGGFNIYTPVGWNVEGSSVTNRFGLVESVSQLLDNGGDFSRFKYGIVITRSTNDVLFHTII